MVFGSQSSCIVGARCSEASISRPGPKSYFVRPRRQQLRLFFLMIRIFPAQNKSYPTFLVSHYMYHVNQILHCHSTGQPQPTSITLLISSVCDNTTKIVGMAEATTCCINHELRRKKKHHWRNQTQHKGYSIKPAVPAAYKKYWPTLRRSTRPPPSRKLRVADISSQRPSRPPHPLLLPCL